jgi:beta-glucosidase
MYGEDPELVAQTSASFIRGMQSAGVAACAKHFIANNQETNRKTTDAHLSKRTLMEIYSRGFEAAIHQGDVKTVMSAYNAINGEFTSYSRELLTDLLRNELGFKGAVVSDWGAASENKEDALAAGLDLIQSGPNDMTECKQAIIDGRLAESVLDERVGHILKLILDIRDFRNGDIAHYNSDELLKIACNTVIAGSVLLKNENNTLPIAKEAKVAFFGQRSKNMLECGSGSTAVATALHSNVYEEFQKLHGPTEFETMDNIDTLIYTVTAPAGENVDREGMVIEADDLHRLPDTLCAAKQSGIKTIVLLNISGPVEMNSWLPWADAGLSIFVPGCMGGVAAAELLTGLAAPGGKLPVTFPVRYQDTPSYPNFPGEHNDVYYGEGIFVGYRSYDKREIPVQFPFGFGLSYTAFDIALDGNEDEFFFNLKDQNSIEIPVRVKNIGKRSGSEVVQIYVSEKIPRVLRPVKELAGYAKVNLNPGDEQVVNVKINKNSLRYYDARMDKWINPIGEHSLLVGTSSEDIIVEARLNVIGDNPYPLSGESTIIEIMKNPAAMTIVNQFTGNMFDKIPKDTLDFMLYRKLNDILSVGMVQVIPDTVKLAAVLNTLYDQLAKI